MNVIKLNNGQYLLNKNEKITKVYIVLSGHLGIYFWNSSVKIN